jgi:hypothetical protein
MFSLVGKNKKGKKRQIENATEDGGDAKKLKGEGQPSDQPTAVEESQSIAQQSSAQADQQLNAQYAYYDPNYYNQYAQYYQQNPSSYDYSYYDQTVWNQWYAQQGYDVTAGNVVVEEPVSQEIVEVPQKQKPEVQKKQKKDASILRGAGGEVWEDPSLKEWDPNDFRLFCGDLGPDVTDELLTRTFRKYPSFLRARVVRDKKSGKSKGFGFVSFKNSDCFLKAYREMDGKFVGNRPIKLRKSNWKDRSITVTKAKKIEKQGYVDLLTKEVLEKQKQEQNSS